MGKNLIAQPVSPQFGPQLFLLLQDKHTNTQKIPFLFFFFYIIKKLEVHHIGKERIVFGFKQANAMETKWGRKGGTGEGGRWESKSSRGYGEGNFYAEEQEAHVASELEGNW